MTDYEAATVRLRRPIADPEPLEFLRYATLAANGHNTQPWRFAVRETGVAIMPDFTRRTPVVDPDDHHLFVSLGCAAENLLIAAEAHGRPGTLTFAADAGRVDIGLATGAPKPGPLYAAISERQSTRSDYDGRAVPAGDLALLAQAAALDGVALILITDADRRERVIDFVVAGNTAQMEDPAFVAELRDWIRFNPAAALATGDGLFSGATGNPSVPTWLGRRLFGWLLDKDGENRKYARQIASSAGVAVFVGDRADPEHWVTVGRSFQRFALQATALGIRHAHINQPVEVRAIRADFARWLGIGEARPDLVVRFGYGPPLPMSLRRPVEAVPA